MDDLFRHLDELRGRERSVAMATLVVAKGTTPKKAGAKMWVGEGGRILGSVTIGGCVDGAVLASAEDVLTTGRSALLSLSLGDEDAFAIGLTCGGAVEVLVERLSLDRDDAALDAYRAARAEHDAGRAAVVVTPLGSGGAAGARLVVRADGSRVGSLGSAELDDAAASAALQAIRNGQSRAVTLGAPVADATADHFLELVAPPTALVVFGATHVAMPLVVFAHELGWRTVVIDARERFATRERFPQADELLVGSLADLAQSMPYTPSTAVVLTAHDYKFEIPVLQVVLESDAGYVGLLGNRKRGAALLDFLADDGVSRAALARVHVPVGLDIGAKSAAEIALSICAEIVATLRNATTVAR